LSRLEIEPNLPALVAYALLTVPDVLVWKYVGFFIYYFSHWWQIRQNSWWFEIIGISVFHPMGHTSCGKCFQLLFSLEKNISSNENTI